MVGQVPAELAESFVMTLRRLKVTGSEVDFLLLIKYHRLLDGL